MKCSNDLKGIYDFLCSERYNRSFNEKDIKKVFENVVHELDSDKKTRVSYLKFNR